MVSNVSLLVASDRRGQTGPTLSLVIPMHNEVENLDPLFDRIDRAMETIGLTHEIICVDDGSTDGTVAGLLRHRLKDQRLKIVKLSRNFGKEVAIMAGLHRCRGSAAVVMDADLQHPPEMIQKFVARWREGYHVVYGVRRSREKETPLRRVLTEAFYWLFARVSEVTLPRGSGDFRLIDRAAVDALNAMPERTRFMKGLFSWTGFKQIGEPFDVVPRRAGRSSWSYWQLFLLAVEAFLGFSRLPLRVWTPLGLLVSLLSALTGMIILVRDLAGDAPIDGYATVLCAVFFLGGVQLVGLGLIAEYLSRMYSEVKGRPMYLVESQFGFEEEAAAAKTIAAGARQP
ncbi:MAG: glycosyltransferase family 2 protein [Thermodesulfobacteriota bacterium]